MNKSIIFNLTVVFILSFLSIFFGFTLFIKFDKEEFYKKTKQKYQKVLHIINKEHFFDNQNSLSLDKLLQPFDVEVVKKEHSLILKNSLVIENYTFEHPPKPPKPKHFEKKEFEDDFFLNHIKKEPPSKHFHKHFNSIELLKHNSNLYIKIDDILLKELNLKPYSNNLALLFFIFIELTLIISYIFTVKTLLPLKKLKKDVERFGNGDFSISFKLNSKDEIAQVANAFENSSRKIEKLIKSRQLFLRNIMHELKTPITKGKIAIELLEDEKNKNRLINVFNRMEILVKESAMIEEITSGENRVNLQKSRLIDLIEEAIDLAMVDKGLVKFEFENRVLNVDFNLFAIAIKNLIDNAIKYSINSEVKIKYENDKLIFISKGDKLNHKLDKYKEPFFKENTTKSQKGLGLGLYIVNEIVKLHKYKLDYLYENGENRFIILLEKI